jgi:inward rectifier potassium channel
MTQSESPPMQVPADDLGIGRVQAEQSSRFLNKDGRFNTRRVGLGTFESLNPFYAMISMSWWLFFSSLTAGFIGINLVFAVLYVLCGKDALYMSTPNPIDDLFWRGFFFSIETLSTIGYGHIAPNNLPAHILSSIEAFLGLLGAALITGVVFSRFSKPNSRILWSKNALIAPFQAGHGLMFRIANGYKNEIIEIAAQVSFSRFEMVDGKRMRKFYNLPLERSTVAFFSLAWTVVHPITPQSPLWGVTETDLETSQAEFIIVIHGLDDVLFQRVHARGSYKAEEVIWKAKFSSMYVPDSNGGVAVDVRKIHEFEIVEAISN